jgi:chemotaxis protein methyltransferase CheR
MNDEEYIYIKKKIRELTKFELDNYGSGQMIRRLDGFITRCHAESVAQYCKMLENDKAEVEKLADFLTINVSEFFRDAVHFKMLREKILPPMLKQSLHLNIWSAGCSNGAEAYSVTMILDQLSPYRTHRIIATDIDKNIIAMAMAGGPYKAADIRNVDPELAAKYFTVNGAEYRVMEKIRGRVSFKQQDLTRDTFEGNFDLIICRNVVIYFNDEAKKKLRKKFFDSLKVNGILFIGATETMLDATETGFQRISPCFYRKTGDVMEKTMTPILK